MPRPVPNRVPPGPEDPRHGQYRGYIAGCRRPCCIAAERTYQARRTRMLAYGRPLKVPTAGTSRRLRALMAIGWSGEYLAERLGVRRANLPTSEKYPTVRSVFAERVKELYDELVRLDGPSERTRRRAEKSGWATPDQWLGRDIDDPSAEPAPVHGLPVDVDEVAVERAAQAARRREAERLQLNRAEMIALIRRGDALGIPRVAIQRHLKVSGTVFAALLAEATKEPA